MRKSKQRESTVNTLTVIEKEGRILLGKKKRGFAEGTWNGFGGKVNIGETVEAAMVRELSEESGLRAIEHEKVGHIDFTLDGGEENIVCHIYKIHSYDGELTETDEMQPAWFDLDDLPYEEMWPDDRYWLPLVLEGKKVTGHFEINNYKVITAHTIEVVDNF